VKTIQGATEKGAEIGMQGLYVFNLLLVGFKNEGSL